MQYGLIFLFTASENVSEIVAEQYQKLFTGCLAFCGLIVLLQCFELIYFHLNVAALAFPLFIVVFARMFFPLGFIFFKKFLVILNFWMVLFWWRSLVFPWFCASLIFSIFRWIFSSNFPCMMEWVLSWVDGIISLSEEMFPWLKLSSEVSLCSSSWIKNWSASFVLIFFDCDVEGWSSSSLLLL